MISIHHLKKTYPEFVLDLDQLTVPKGRICGLVGTNGSGKSTTFKILLGLVEADSGEAKIFDQNVWNLPVALKQDIGVVFNDSGYDPNFRLTDIAEVQKAFFPSFDESWFYSLCSQMELPKDQKISSFSTGMLARLKVIAAISHHPKLLILDEPTSGLDVIARGKILDLIGKHMEKEDNSVLISSHIASDLEEICDDFYMIHDGKIVLHQTIDQLLNEFGILLLNEQQYEQLDKRAVLAMMKDRSGIRVLVSDRQFYQENYPDLVLDKGGIDNMIRIFEEGSRL